MKPGKLFLSFVGLHFFLIFLGIAKTTLPTKPLADAQRFYSRITGAGGSYAFFSPNVSRELIVQFKVVDKDGHEFVTSIREMHGNEVRMRLSNMIRLLEKNYKNEKALRSVAASLTAYVYRKFPDARSVTLDSYIYALPTMPEFREGKAVELKPVYSAKFGRRI